VHFDAYDMWDNMEKEIRKMINEHGPDYGTGLQWILEHFDKIRWITGENDPPTVEQIEELKEFSHNCNHAALSNYVDGPYPWSWYELLHKNQGTLEGILKAGYCISEYISDKREEMDYMQCVVNFDKLTIGDERPFILKN